MMRKKAELSPARRDSSETYTPVGKNILVVINNSPDLVTEAIKLTCPDKEKIRLIALKVLPLYEGELHLTGIGNLREVIEGGKDEYMQAVRKIASQSGIAIDIRLEYGEPAEKIVAVALEEDCALIVLEGHKNRVTRLLSGNVVKKIRAGVSCPVFEL
ncbi:MAG: universal stress protein [Desulfobacterales bacterium]|nr:universal stress protein [Desulfobacterales bacterium]